MIKKKLSSKDPSYQRLINKEGLENQDDRADLSHYLPTIDPNAAEGTGTIPGELAKRRPEREILPVFKSGKLISDKVKKQYIRDLYYESSKIFYSYL